MIKNLFSIHLCKITLQKGKLLNIDWRYRIKLIISDSSTTSSKKSKNSSYFTKIKKERNRNT